MDTQQTIADLNGRASKIWINPRNSDYEVVAVCLYVEVNFAQAWFSHWHQKGSMPTYYDKFIAEGKDIDDALFYLDEYLSIQEVRSDMLEKDGERIVDEIGFGD